MYASIHFITTYIHDSTTSHPPRFTPLYWKVLGGGFVSTCNPLRAFKFWVSDDWEKKESMAINPTLSMKAAANMRGHSGMVGG